MLSILINQHIKLFHINDHLNRGPVHPYLTVPAFKVTLDFATCHLANMSLGNLILREDTFNISDFKKITK